MSEPKLGRIEFAPNAYPKVMTGGHHDPVLQTTRRDTTVDAMLDIQRDIVASLEAQQAALRLIAEVLQQQLEILEHIAGGTDPAKD